jgi:hypothetical protein
MRLETVIFLIIGFASLASFMWVGFVWIALGHWSGVLTVVLGLLFGYIYLFRMAPVGVYESSEGIRVRKWFRTYRVPWSHVRRFGLESKPAWWRGYVVLGFVELQDGSRIDFSGMWVSVPRSGWNSGWTSGVEIPVT